MTLNSTMPRASALAIFIQPPSAEVLAQRLRGRGTEDEESLRKRISKSEQELEFAPRFDKVVINDRLERFPPNSDL